MLKWLKVQKENPSSDLVSGQNGTPLLVRRDGVGIFGGPLRMRKEAGSFTRCRRAGGQKNYRLGKPPRGSR